MSAKRNLPSWMDKGQSSGGRRPIDDDGSENSDEGEKRKGRKGRSRSVEKPASFSNLLEGVVFVLSGFVNPERGVLRSQALEMGAEYQPDWNSGCTLLICAFPNTPKFRQVQAGCGTIVSKEWISECHSQKKLVDIESYLMHAGKPWRRSNVSTESGNESSTSPPRRSHKQDEGPQPNPTGSVIPKNKASPGKAHFSPSKVKVWAIDDLNDTISWLESQEEKPEPSEIKKIAAQGILTCLQDAIDSLEQMQDIHKITEQWNFVPHVVKELLKLEGKGGNGVPISKQDLYKQAKDCKRVYEMEFDRLEDDSLLEKKRKTKTNKQKSTGRGIKANSSNTSGYDSDETIKMTEEEIDLAYNHISSKLHSY